MGLGTAQLASLLGKEVPKVFRYVAKSIGNPEKFPPLGPIDLAKKFKTTATPKTIYKYSQDKSFLKDLVQCEVKIENSTIEDFVILRNY